MSQYTNRKLYREQQKDAAAMYSLARQYAHHAATETVPAMQTYYAQMAIDAQNGAAAQSAAVRRAFGIIETATFVSLPRHIWIKAGVPTPSAWEVNISYNHSRYPGCYGYFESDKTGAGGGLWFERDSNGAWELIDYDGMGVLPTSVSKTLREAGFVVGPEFDND